MSDTRESTNGRKRRIRAFKAANHWERTAARCKGCVHVDREQSAIPRERPYVPWWCLLGQFVTQPDSVCDQWDGKDGDWIEGAQG